MNNKDIHSLEKRIERLEKFSEVLNEERWENYRTLVEIEKKRNSKTSEIYNDFCDLKKDVQLVLIDHMKYLHTAVKSINKFLKDRQKIDIDEDQFFDWELKLKKIENKPMGIIEDE